MKILHIALNYIVPQEALNLALSSFASEYKQIDWIALNKQMGTPNLRKHIIEESNKFNPDITFMQIQNPDIIDEETAKALKGFVVNWTGDVRQPLPKWYYRIGKQINLTLFTNVNDIEALKTFGINADYLQIGYSDINFKLNENENNIKQADIVFMGNNYNRLFPLSDMRLEMIKQLKNKFGIRFNVYGTGWEANGYRNNLMFKEKQESAVYNNCKIAINLSHFDLKRYSSDRIFRIMGSGAFCLTKYYPEIEKDFIDGEHLAVWHDLEDLKDKISYYLENETLRRMIANNGYDKVRKEDTWHIRIHRDFNKILQIWKK